MKGVTSGELTEEFGTASIVRPARKPKKKRPSPLSVRLSDDEWAQLREWAGRTPLSTFAKLCIFEGKKPRKARSRTNVEEFDALARVLAALGRTDAFRNLDKLVRMAEEGALDLSDENVQIILAACACISAMRDDLMCALGLKAS